MGHIPYWLELNSNCAVYSLVVADLPCCHCLLFPITIREYSRRSSPWNQQAQTGHVKQDTYRENLYTFSLSQLTRDNSSWLDRVPTCTQLHSPTYTKHRAYPALPITGIGNSWV